MGLTLEVACLNEPLKDFGGEALVFRHPMTGEILPESQQLTLGDVLLNLLGQMQAENGKEAILAFSVGEAIARGMQEQGLPGPAQEAGSPPPKGSYRAGETALGILRKAARENRPGYVARIMGQVHRLLGGQEEVEG